MAITWKGFTGFLQDEIAAVQGAAGATVDSSVGSLTRAWCQAVAGAALWLQGLVAQLLGLTRASTSTGADLDSWMADYFLTRPPAVAASGNVTFSRFTATAQAVVPAGFGPNTIGAPIGALISTGPSGQQFYVSIDLNNASYNAGFGGYVLAGGTASVTVPVVALTPGTAGNLNANTLTSFVQPILGVDSVTNAAAFVSGQDAMSDANLRKLFQAYILSLQHGTPAAIEYAITSYQPGLTVDIFEDVDTSGTFQPGWFVVVVDNGTGTLTSSQIAALQTQVEAYRAITTVGTVIPPVITRANVSMQLTLTTGASSLVIAPAVNAAITKYINALPVGATLPFNRLVQVAFDASPAVTNVTNITLNTATVDLVPTRFGVIKAGTITVS